MKPMVFLLLLSTPIASPLQAESKTDSSPLVPPAKMPKMTEAIASCAGKAAGALFTTSNELTIVVEKDSWRSELFLEIAKRVFTEKSARLVKTIGSLDWTPPPLGESNLLLMEKRNNYLRFMRHPSVYRLYEYLIISESGREELSRFARELWALGYAKVAFVWVSNESASLLRPIQEKRGSVPSLEDFELCSSSWGPQKYKNEKPSNGTTAAVHPFTSMLQTPTNSVLKFSKIVEGTYHKFYDVKVKRIERQPTSLGAYLMELFAAKYGMRVERSRWEGYENATWTEARERCVAGDVDFFYDPQLPPGNNCCEVVEPATWYQYETLAFVDCVKSSPNLLEGLLLPYKGIVWVCNVGLLVIFAVFASALEYLWSLGLVRERITALHIWGAFVGQTLPGFPTKIGLRFVLLIWIFHNLYNNFLYTSKIKTALTGSHTHTLHTYRDILRSGRPICGGTKTKELLNYTSDPLIRKIHDRMETVVPKDAFDKILHENHICTRHVNWVHVHNQIYKANASLHLYIIPDAFVVNYPSSIFAKKRSPYVEDFRLLVSHFRDSGIINSRHGLYSESWQMVSLRTISQVPKSSDVEYLGLQHVAVAFYVLIVGHVVASVVVIVELYIHD